MKKGWKILIGVGITGNPISRIVINLPKITFPAEKRGFVFLVYSSIYVSWTDV